MVRFIYWYPHPMHKLWADSVTDKHTPFLPESWLETFRLAPAIVHQIVSKLEQPQQVAEPGKSKMGMGLTLHKLLPRTDCQKCGRKTCLSFAIDLAKGKCRLEDCPPLSQPEFAESRNALAKLLE